MKLGSAGQQIQGPPPKAGGIDGWSWIARPAIPKAAFAMMALFALIACGSTASESGSASTAAPKTTLTISGAGGTTKVLELLADAYTQENDDLAFKFLSGSGSGGGVKGVVGGQLHLGAMSRLPKQVELSSGIEYLNFAQDRVAVVTSADLSISGLTSQQVKDIFLGAIVDWSEVGGRAARINVLVREEKDSNTKILRKGIIGDVGFAPGSVTMTSEAATKAALTTATNTVAYLAYSGVRIENLALHAIALDGQDPADFGGAYPLEVRQLGVAYLPANAGQLQPFLDFIVEPQAQALLAEHGIGPVHIGSGARSR